MIDINEIFPKTSDEIKTTGDCWKILKIAGFKSKVNDECFCIRVNEDLFDDAKAIKKLYDNQRDLFIRLCDMLSNHTRRCVVDKYGNCQDHTKFTGIETKPADMSKCDCEIKDAFETVERITGKTWEELQG